MASFLDPRFKATRIADDGKEYIKTSAAAENSVTARKAGNINGGVSTTDKRSCRTQRDGGSKASKAKSG